MMPYEIWIAGLPPALNGAGTELDHLIDLFRDHGVDIHVVPLKSEHNPTVLESLQQRRCAIHSFDSSIFKNKTVICFADGGFLKQLPQLVEYGRPGRIIWFNCSTKTYADELKAHAAKWIDLHGFVSTYQKSRLLPALEAVGPVLTFPYRPFLNLKRIPWHYRPWNDTYAIGRISRDDVLKFPRDTWRMFDRVLLPVGLAKQINILGFGVQAATKTGAAPRHLSVRLWRPGEISATDFYRSIDTLIYKNDGAQDSYGRIVIEACAHGVVPVVQNDFAFPELIVHGETGFLGNDSDELSYYASYLAHHPQRHFEMASNARLHIENLMDPALCWQPWEELLATKILT